MSKRALDAGPLSHAMGAGAPVQLDRAARVRLLAQAADDLLAGRKCSTAAGLYVGGALASWLRNGGDLERDYLGVKKNGSHTTPSKLWKSLLSKDDGRAAQGLPSALDQPSRPKK